MSAKDVTFDVLQAWWNAIIGMDHMLLEDHASALEGLQGVAYELGLPALPDISLNVPPVLDLIHDKPAFKNLDLNAIKYLRHCIITKSDTATLEVWAEILLRFMEINLHRLSNRVGSQFGFSQKRESLLCLAAFTMDYYEYSRDLCHLNLAMKLMDIPGLISVTRISKELKGNRDVDEITFFAVRLILMRKTALKRLETGIGKKK